MTDESQASDDLDPGGESSSSITVDDEQDVPVDRSFLRALAARALEALAVPGDAALAITLVGPDRMAELKEKALGREPGEQRAPTDVLAFPMDDPAHPMPGPFVVGDVVICPAVATEQARASGHSLNSELAILLVHGILHCLGRDHASKDEEKSMFAEQADVLLAVTGGALR
jgi:probable rRNA maturation factor